MHKGCSTLRRGETHNVKYNPDINYITWWKDKYAWILLQEQILVSCFPTLISQLRICMLTNEKKSDYSYNFPAHIAPLHFHIRTQETPAAIKESPSTDYMQLIATTIIETTT